MLPVGGDRNVTSDLMSYHKGGVYRAASPRTYTTAPEKSVIREGGASAQKDSISISDTARTLSSIENEQKRQLSEKTDPTTSDPAKDELRKRTMELSVVELAKYFPPFLNPARRREIIEKYPFFRQQIDSMTVPPPFGYSPELIRSVRDTVRSEKPTEEASTGR